MRVPIVSLRDAVLFPEERFAMSVGRMRSLEALATGGEILVLAQRDPASDEPGPQGHHDFGCIAELVRAVPREDGALDVTVRGLHRARVESISVAAFLSANVAIVEDDGVDFDTARIREYATRIAAFVWGVSVRSARRSVERMTAGRAADVVIGPATLPLEERRALLEETRTAARVGRVLADAKKWNFRLAKPESWIGRARRALSSPRSLA